MKSLRNAINNKCRDCIVDSCAPGNWRQQVQLCAVKLCPLYDVRPKSSAPIPERLLSYYGAEKGAEEASREFSEALRGPK